MATPTQGRPCWICGQPANSNEHFPKKTDIFRLFGRRTFPKGSRLIKTSENGKKTLIQGPGSRHLTFENVLCQPCNNSLTQRFDLSYDRFIAYVAANAASVLRDRRIDLRKVFGICGHRNRENLFKYFVKFLGCRIANENLNVPRDLSDALTSGSLPSGLSLSFCVNEPLVANSPVPEKLAQVHHLQGTYDNLMKTHVDFVCAYSYGWMSTVCWYKRNVNPSLGDAWNGRDRFLVLGSLNDVAI